MRRAPWLIAILFVVPLALMGAADAITFPPPPAAPKPFARPDVPAQSARTGSVLDKHLLVTWYGHPWSGRMGLLGRLEGVALAEGVKRQAAGYAAASRKPVPPAYELVAIVAQPLPGRDGRYRRRESRHVIDRMLREARAAGFKLILDVQTGRSTVLDELSYLAPYLQEIGRASCRGRVTVMGGAVHSVRFTERRGR